MDCSAPASRLDQPHRLARRQAGGMRACATALAPATGAAGVPEPAGEPCGRGAATAAAVRRSSSDLQRLVQRRQVGGVGEPDQHHLGGADRPVGRLHLGNALEQHLPGRATARAPTASSAKSAPRWRSSSRQRGVVGGRRHESQAGHEMVELGKVGQHRGRIGAGIVLRAELGQRRRRRRPS